MEFSTPLIQGTFIRRYKRFFVDVQLDKDTVVTAHCPNTGTMRSCLGDGWPVCVSASNNPKRKLKYTWELVHNGHCWIAINTQLTNAVAAEALDACRIPELAGVVDWRREVKYGENSRIDFLGEDGGRRCFVEVKNVTLAKDGRCTFPDAVTVRGQKHLRELTRVARDGARAVMLYLIARSDAQVFGPAADIDPDYAREMRIAADVGVELLPYRADVSPTGITLTNERVPFEW